MYREYEIWKNYKNLEPNLKAELDSLTDEEIKEAFHSDLEFGTGGIRGIMGVGTSRMNIYTLRIANYGYGNFLLNKYKNPVVVIAYDNRKNSYEFAIDSARTLASFGIKVYLFREITPTPVLSFAIRHLKADGGIVITASHNPPIYNGYKVYHNDGGQLVPELADMVISESKKVEDIFSLDINELDSLLKEKKIEFLDDSVNVAYIEEVKNITLNNNFDKSNCKIVFTPLHGTSANLGVRILDSLGYNVIPVEEQMVKDPNFSTVKSPNPENHEAFTLAIKYAKANNADLCIATDPDADRIGIAYRDKDEYKLITGNQIGAIILYYLVNNRKNLSNHVMLNTIVTSNLGAEIVKSKGIEVISTLTGFRYIAEQIKLLEGTNKKFFFGYEESFGYLVSDFVRDKDSLQSMVILAELTNYYLHQNKTLTAVLEEIYSIYGYFVEETMNFTYEGLSGAKKINDIMDFFRVNELREIINLKVEKIEDYSKDIELNNGLVYPKANVLKYYLEDGTWFALRPSGTEPKLKIYISIKSKNKKESEIKLQKLKNELVSLVEEVK